MTETSAKVNSAIFTQTHTMYIQEMSPFVNNVEFLLRKRQMSVMFNHRCTQISRCRWSNATTLLMSLAEKAVMKFRFGYSDSDKTITAVRNQLKLQKKLHTMYIQPMSSLVNNVDFLPRKRHLSVMFSEMSVQGRRKKVIRCDDAIFTSSRVEAPFPMVPLSQALLQL